jgi:hypothetical protein
MILCFAAVGVKRNRTTLLCKRGGGGKAICGVEEPLAMAASMWARRRRRPLGAAGDPGDGDPATKARVPQSEQLSVRADLNIRFAIHLEGGDFRMAKKSRGGRMTAAKKRAAKKSGGRGAIKKRAAGRNIMKT